MPTVSKIATEGLDWPTTTTTTSSDDEQQLSRVTIECAGKGFVDYYALLNADHNELWSSIVAESEAEAKAAAEGGAGNNEDGSNEKGLQANGAADDDDLPLAIDLFSLSEKQLEKLDYYKVLRLPYKPTITPDDVKKAYRKACLKYHPDKSGRDEEDAVFLKVKAAFETLSTNKLAYDSTEMPFDDSLPPEQPKDFFKEYGPVFRRNAHFDAKLLPRQNSSGGGGGGGGRRKSRGNNNKNQKQQNLTPKGPPSIGDENTPIDEVHDFYDYWTHFDSWRDFTLQAQRESETEDSIENAESRYEKRWYQKEADRQAKKLKQEEIRRIATLVERAMAVDPRLVQERKRLAEEKEQKKRDRERQALEKKQQEEEARLAEERRVEEEKKRKTEEKFLREKEKKMLRKTKQAFKRYVSAALEELLEKEYALEDEVDLICAELNRDLLTKFNTRLDGKPASEVFAMVKKRAEGIKNGIIDDDEPDSTSNGIKENGGGDNGNSESSCTNGVDPKTSAAQEPTGSSSSNSNNKTTESETTEDTSGKENDTSAKHGASSSTSSNTKAKNPFTKEELSALAKGVKKFPPGGANRWDSIANYINNLCRPEDPRTKEECIEKFNQINKASKLGRGGTTSTTTNGSAGPQNGGQTTSSTPAESDGWTTEQNEQLQAALAKYPGTMEKNERWAKIADDVTGKSKKDCVLRFKSIRDAIKAKK